MFSAGMLTALASAMIVRSRGFESGRRRPLGRRRSISLMIRVKIAAALGVGGALLVLDRVPLGMARHAGTPEKTGGKSARICTMGPVGQQVSPAAEPAAATRRPEVPGTAPVVAQHRGDPEAGRLHAGHHRRQRQRPERQREPVACASSGRAARRTPGRRWSASAAGPDEPTRSASRGPRPAGCGPGSATRFAVLVPRRQVRHEVDPEHAAGPRAPARPPTASPRGRASRVSDCRMP